MGSRTRLEHIAAIKETFQRAGSLLQEEGRVISIHLYECGHEEGKEYVLGAAFRLPDARYIHLQAGSGEGDNQFALSLPVLAVTEEIPPGKKRPFLHLWKPEDMGVLIRYVLDKEKKQSSQ